MINIPIPFINNYLIKDFKYYPDDKRKGYFCIYCNYKTLNLQGIVVHLAKKHDIHKIKNIKYSKIKQEIKDKLLSNSKIIKYGERNIMFANNFYLIRVDDFNDIFEGD